MRSFTSFRFCIFLLCLVSAQAIANNTVESSLPKGKHQFTFSQWAVTPLEVWAYTPSEYNNNSKVLFVMHGTNRDADRYRDEWTALAEQHNLLLIAAQFTKENFPRSLAYNLGNVFATTEFKQVNPKEKWAFSAIEPLFDYVKTKYSNQSTDYLLYGHSAGSQFVHRFIFFVPQARVSKIVTANAGWYTRPDFTIDFPYGLNNTPVTENDLLAALQKPVVVLLGEADNDPEHPSLRRAAPAMAQGPHRLARGYYFYAQAKQLAEKHNIPFNWQLTTVPEVGHQNGLMAHAAIVSLLN